MPVVALACLATAVWGQAPRAGDVISTTAAPGGFIAGMAWDGEHLWCADRNARQIMQVRLDDGEVLKSFPTLGGHVAGLDWHEGKLWESDARLRRVCRIDPNDGSVELEIDHQGVEPTGVLVRDGRVYVADWSRPFVYVYRADTGELIDQKPSPANPLWGAAQSRRRLWFVNPRTRMAYAIEPDAWLLDAALPIPVTKPAGAVMIEDGLWVADWNADTVTVIAANVEPGANLAGLTSAVPMTGQAEPTPRSRRWWWLIAAPAAVLGGLAATWVVLRRRRKDYALLPEVLYTFLAVDVRRSTELKQGEDAVRVRRTFDAYHHWVRRTARKHNGEVYSTSGDGVLCRFARATDALAAARAMRYALDGFNADHNRLAGPVLIGMGLHTGPLLEGGGDERGTVASATIDFAMKLQAQAQPREILLSGETLAGLPSREGIQEAGQLFRQMAVYRVA